MRAGGPVQRLYQAVRDSGSPLADALGDAPAQAERPQDGQSHPGIAAAAGPRVAATRPEIELAVTAVHEGYRLHYDPERGLPIDDPNLALLAGDRLYALGLERLAAIGDLHAIAELADVIALSAQAHASGDAELARATWLAGAAAVGHGPSAAVDDAKGRARAGDPQAVAALLAAAELATDF